MQCRTSIACLPASSRWCATPAPPSCHRLISSPGSTRCGARSSAPRTSGLPAPSQPSARKPSGWRALTEYSLQAWIKEKFAAGGLEADHGPIVAIGPNAANPHYEPTAEKSATIKRGDILLVDLWAREKNGVYADQTWMGSLGPPSDRDRSIWQAVRDARDAAISLLQKKIGGHQPVKGGEVDDAARDVITKRGYGQYFFHRTGHSIDPRDLHGSGPHIDNLETREERALIPGVGFSIEPGVYLAGDVGMRSEVNGFIGDDGLLITPADYQKELLVV
jgi:Xaa-Pro dipeptidase